MTRQDGEMDQLGGDAFIGYAPTGGKCVRRNCRRDAPVVRIGESVLRQPCEIHEAEIAEEWEREERARLMAQALVDSGLTARQREFTLDSYEKACGDEAGLAALAVARRWLRTYLDGGSAGNLVLYGPIGVGKTGLASGIVRAVCEEGRLTVDGSGEPIRVHAAKMVAFKALLNAMKECFDRHEPTAHALSVGRVPLLVLDDLGAERPTEWTRDELLGIVDYRYEKGLPTIYVSNYKLSDLARRLSGSDRDAGGERDLTVGQRITSRMREGATTFEFTGRDRRERVA